jgi:hypothetical protein
MTSLIVINPQPDLEEEFDDVIEEPSDSIPALCM